MTAKTAWIFSFDFTFDTPAKCSIITSFLTPLNLVKAKSNMLLHGAEELFVTLIVVQFYSNVLILGIASVLLYIRAKHHAIVLQTW